MTKPDFSNDSRQTQPQNTVPRLSQNFPSREGNPVRWQAWTSNPLWGANTVPAWFDSEYPPPIPNTIRRTMDIDAKRLLQRTWLTKRREEFLTPMGPCYFCGGTERLTIHHINPEEKISHKIWSWTVERIKEELKKCIVLCEDCHNKYHRLQKIKPFRHGTWVAYQKYKCRCDECRAVRSSYYQEKEQ